MLYHITYRDRSGTIQTGRSGGKNRSEAVTYAACKYNVSRRAILSAVALPSRNPGVAPAGSALDNSSEN